MDKRLAVLPLIILLISACSERLDIIDDADAPDMTGEAVQFASLRKSSTTRASFETEASSSIGAYTYAGKDALDQFYNFEVKMFANGSNDVIGTATYQIVEDTQDGTLNTKFGTQPLYWPDSNTSYAFEATAGNTTLSADQDNVTGESFRQNDLLHGYGYMPYRSDDINALNFRTSKQWYTASKVVLNGETGVTAEDYKKVPLYLQHQRSWITLVLKAGKGVNRNALYYSNTGGSNLITEIYSDPETGNDLAITPWRTAGIVTYEIADTNGPAGNDSTTILHAIVEPHEYTLDQTIGKIVLNGMTFTYAPSNDKDITTNEAAALDKYKLTAGKHLTITATLSKDHIVLITALLEDWENVVFSSICDDYGNNGNPTVIYSRKQLIDFLNDESENKAGNTALLATPTLDLDTIGEPWEPKELKCALNLAGCKVNSKGAFLSSIENNASLVNGTINITGQNSMTAAICETNKGLIEQINVSVAENVSNIVYATKGGLVDVNYGNILNCENNLQVKGKVGYIGGICAESKIGDWDAATKPSIDGCVMNARVGYDGQNSEVDSDTGFSGAGGIAGYAESTLTRCTNNYGMSLLQNSDKLQNIVQATSSDNAKKIQESNSNTWPTSRDNKIANTQLVWKNDLAPYFGVLDCQDELKALVTGYEYNVINRRYRIASDFTVDDTWDFEQRDGENSITAHATKFELDGNNKTITTNGSMLFNEISSYFHDFTIECNTDLVVDISATTTDEVSKASVKSIAALAQSVHNGVDNTQAHLSNIKVNAKEINGPIIAGLVVWAYNGATIEDCKVKATLNSKLPEGFSNWDEKKYAGGIVAQSAQATLIGCHFYGAINEMTPTAEQAADERFTLRHHFRGGIVGGVAKDNDKETPQTTINDCASWWGPVQETFDPKTTSPAGAIIGTTKYGTQSFDNGIKDKACSGNWWISGRAAASPGSGGVGTFMTDDEITSLIGKKNGVQPEQDEDLTRNIL